MSVIAENPDDQSAAVTARKPRTRRQPQPIQSPASKASQLEDAAYGRLLERADVKEALFRGEVQPDALVMGPRRLVGEA